MTLLPFNSVCQACCSRDASFTFCVETCVPNMSGGFEHASRIGDDPHPHLHRKCATCGYEWLERCLGIAEGSDGQLAT